MSITNLKVTQLEFTGGCVDETNAVVYALNVLLLTRVSSRQVTCVYYVP